MLNRISLATGARQAIEVVAFVRNATADVSYFPLNVITTALEILSRSDGNIIANVLTARASATVSAKAGVDVGIIDPKIIKARSVNGQSKATASRDLLAVGEAISPAQILKAVASKGSGPRKR